MCKTIFTLICLCLSLVSFSSCSPPTWEEIEASYQSSCPDEVRKSAGKLSQHAHFDTYAKKHCDCMFKQMRKKYKTPIDQFKDKKLETFVENATKYCASKHLSQL